MTLELGFWGEAVLNNLAAWFVTYLVYSTVTLGAVALLARQTFVSAGAESALWRMTLVLTPLATTARIAVEHLGPLPVAKGPEALAVAGAAGSVLVAVAVISAGVAGLLTGRLGRVAARERRRLADRVPVTEGEDLDLLRAVAREAGRPVPVLSVSPSVRGPLVIGSREICIPVDGFGELDADVRRAVFAHELGHLDRRDNTWTAAASFLEHLFFLQPLHRLARRRLRESAEFLADAYAVRLTGRPEHLVAGLAALVRSSEDPVTASAFGPDSLLVRRVRHVLDGAVQGPGPSGWLLHGLAWGLAVIVWLTPAAVPAYDCRVTGALPEVASWFLLHV